MRIALISQDYAPLVGGIASYLKNFLDLNYPDDEKHVIVPTSIGSTNNTQSSVHIHRTAFAPFDHNNQARTSSSEGIDRILEAINPDEIIIGYLRSHPEAALSYRRRHPGTRCTIIMHAKEAFLDDAIVACTNINGSHKGYTQDEVLFYKDVLHDMDTIHAVSEYTQRLLRSQGISNNIIVSYPRIRRPEPFGRDAARKALGIGRDTAVLLSVGRLIERKGQNEVVGALPCLLANNHVLLYIIAGEGPCRASLENKSRQFGRSVRITGTVDNTTRNMLYSAADIFVLPTKFLPPNDIEGFGIVFVEANSHGLPVIAGATGGVPEAVDRASSILINPQQPSELVHAMRTLMENKDLRATMSTNAFLHAERFYLPDKNTSSHND